MNHKKNIIHCLARRKLPNMAADAALARMVDELPDVA